MEFRASERTICEQVRKDTKAVCEELGIGPAVVKGSLSLASITKSLRRTLVDKPFPMARSIEEMREACQVADTQEDWLLVVKHWLGRLLSQPHKALNRHTYYYGDDQRCQMKVVLIDGSLCLRVWAGGSEVLATMERVLDISGKPSRVLGKIFGEKFITHLCQHYPIKPSSYELHFARNYIPELYQMVARDEDLTSCMSKHSREYDLPDNAHPTLAYEDSRNAVLSLLYSKEKERYVARAITGLRLPSNGEMLQYSTAYGSSGCRDRFQEAGLYQDTDMTGLELSIKWCDGERLVPYVDGDSQRMEEVGGRLVVDEDGSIEGSYETGREMAERFHCHCCSEDREGEEHRTVDGVVCESCYEDYVQVDDSMIHKDNACYIRSEDEWVREDEAHWCDWSDEWYRSDDAFYDVKILGRTYSFVAHESQIGDINNHHTIEEIDGEPYVTYLENMGEAA